MRLVIYLASMVAAGCAAEESTQAPPADASGIDRVLLDAATDRPSLDATAIDRAHADTLSDACRFARCGSACCERTQLCRYDRCVDDLGRCDADAGASRCPSDSYCDAMGFCTLYGVPAERDRDPSCTARAIPAPLVPAAQCEWTLHGANGTPVVADLLLDARAPGDPARPSVVLAIQDAPGNVYTSAGHIHVFDGRTCALQAALSDASQIVSSAGTPALGDLDLDGRPEIVAPSGTGGLIAFRYDPAARAWSTFWRSDMHPGPFTGGAVALADLGGDGHPEVVLGGFVYDWQGRLLDGALGELPYQGYSTPVALADVDLDGATELVGNNAIYALRGARLTREPYDMATASPGFVAVADFGDFPGRRGDAPGRPEIVFYATPRLVIRTVGGDTVFSADATPIAGGGAPAVADLDGDGQPEVVVAGRAMMAFDPDCTAAPTRGGRCASGRTDGVLWLQSGLQDGSSAINGVTVFDFDGDGRVEVVEADECFVRIFDGTTGTPRWSAARFSCTFVEMPVVADVDGDLSAEIVVPANAACASSRVCGLSTGAPDPILPGFACASDEACPSATRCRAGLCRCTESAQCGENNVCTPPLGAGDGMGNVCRSTFRPTVGMKVYGDARGRWVPSRPIWNQYAYAITNVGDDGAIPAAGAARNNWQVAGLNNFRQNTQGALGDRTAPNLTVAPSPRGCVDDGRGALRLVARFCNRGTGVAGADSSIRFEALGADGGRSPLCTATASRPIAPGTCLEVTCDAMQRLDAGASVEAVADANAQVQECREDDNTRVIYRPGDCVL